MSTPAPAKSTASTTASHATMSNTNMIAIAISLTIALVALVGIAGILYVNLRSRRRRMEAEAVETGRPQDLQVRIVQSREIDGVEIDSQRRRSRFSIWRSSRRKSAPHERPPLPTTMVPPMPPMSERVHRPAPLDFVSIRPPQPAAVRSGGQILDVHSARKLIDKFDRTPRQARPSIASLSDFTDFSYTGPALQPAPTALSNARLRRGPSVTSVSDFTDFSTPGVQRGASARAGLQRQTSSQVGSSAAGVSGEPNQTPQVPPRSASRNLPQSPSVVPPTPPGYITGNTIRMQPQYLPNLNVGRPVAAGPRPYSPTMTAVTEAPSAQQSPITGNTSSTAKQSGSEGLLGTGNYSPGARSALTNPWSHEGHETRDTSPNRAVRQSFATFGGLMSGAPTSSAHSDSAHPTSSRPVSGLPALPGVAIHRQESLPLMISSSQRRSRPISGLPPTSGRRDSLPLTYSTALHRNSRPVSGLPPTSEGHVSLTLDIPHGAHRLANQRSFDSEIQDSFLRLSPSTTIPSTESGSMSRSGSSSSGLGSLPPFPSAASYNRFAARMGMPPVPDTPMAAGFVPQRASAVPSVQSTILFASVNASPDDIASATPHELPKPPPPPLKVRTLPTPLPGVAPGPVMQTLQTPRPLPSPPAARTLESGLWGRPALPPSGPRVNVADARRPMVITQATHPSWRMTQDFPEDV